jgi:hypothetical protein
VRWCFAIDFFDFSKSSVFERRKKEPIVAISTRYTHAERERERERKRERESETSARKKKRTTRPVLPHRAVRLADAIVVNIALSD